VYRTIQKYENEQFGHGFRCCINKHPIELQSKSKGTNKNEDTIIDQFYQENCLKYINRIVPSVHVYNDFQEWSSKKEIPTVSHKAFTLIIKRLFNVQSKYHRFSHSPSPMMPLHFGDTSNDELVKEYIKQNVTNTYSTKSFLTMKELNDGFKNSPQYHGQNLDIAQVAK